MAAIKELFGLCKNIYINRSANKVKVYDTLAHGFLLVTLCKVSGVIPKPQVITAIQNKHKVILAKPWVLNTVPAQNICPINHQAPQWEQVFPVPKAIH